ncbi:MAG: HAMP domain-containing histidine kinase [Bacteroidales bacterium]|nr:HAMP domain-containing histidine kinase [Bacteroidales bacterium]
MKKNVIIFVIVVITISLIGLVAMQLYWISNAFSVKESNFNRGVGEAITIAINKYNKIEMANAILLRQEQDRKVGRFFEALDSINREYYQQVLRTMENDRHTIDDQLPGWQADGQYLSSDPFYERRSLNSFDTTTLQGQRNLRDRGYAIRQGLDNEPQDAFIEFFQRTRFVNDLFDDLFSSNSFYSPSSDESKHLLDSLIGRELDRQGIKTEYEFGIYDPVYNTLLAQKSGKYPQELMQSGYIFSLYPNDVFRSQEYLFLYFPNQKTYLITQMNIMTIASTLFILVIISSFTYTIITIIRQKKLSLIKNDFINNMTHELKTPISTISLACQALSDKDVQKSETLYQSYIRVINEENQRLGMMTEKVLQTAQLEKGKLRLNKVGFNLHDVIEDAIHKIDLQLKTRHGKIFTNLGAEFSFLEADKVHLTNLVFNLLDNAIKYSPESPQITISTENVNKGILIHVEDKGMGISKANQKKIFDNLYRVSTGNLHNVKGFGLGLSYVKAIVELHGGYIKLQSELKKGSCFTIFVPFGFDEYSSGKS